MEIFLTILAFFCLIIGIVGSVIPALPGPALSYIGMIMLYFLDFDISQKTLIIFGVIIAIITILDYVMAPYLTKKSGGSRSATIGSVVGVVLCIFVIPISIFLGAFFGAYVGELLHDSSNQKKALRVGFFSFLGFISGIFMALIVTIYILVISIIAVI